MADTDGSSDPQISFKVKTSGDGLHSITMAESATVLDLKTKLATEAYENIPVERQRLIYSGRVMKNDDTLGSYRIKAGNTLHLVKSAASNHPPAGSGAATAAGSSASGAPSSAVPPVIPTNMAAGTANDLLAGLTGARYAGLANLPNRDMFGPDGGMNFANEDQMAEMLQNPAVAQSLNEALNNPDVVNHIINTNPMLRNAPNARELIQSPMFRQMLTDPEAMRAVGRLRSTMRGMGSFPAPGATDNTPADAAASPAGAAPGAERPAAAAMLNPFLFGGFPGAAGAAGPGGAAAPFPSGGTPEQTRQELDALEQMASALRTLRDANGAAGDNLAGMPFFNLFGGAAGAAGAPPAPAQETRSPEELYATQLRQLNDMGFYDFDQNVAALRRSGGSVEGALAHLLGN